MGSLLAMLDLESLISELENTPHHDRVHFVVVILKDYVALVQSLSPLST